MDIHITRNASRIEAYFDELTHVDEVFCVYPNNACFMQVFHWTTSQGSGGPLFSYLLENSENLRTSGLQVNPEFKVKNGEQWLGFTDFHLKENKTNPTTNIIILFSRDPQHNNVRMDFNVTAKKT